MVKNILILMIRFYQMVISAYLPSRCRFYPTCSQYSLEAIQRYGSIRGVWLSVKRLSKCHPFHPGGVEGVPKL